MSPPRFLPLLAAALLGGAVAVLADRLMDRPEGPDPRLRAELLQESVELRDAHKELLARVARIEAVAADLAEAVSTRAGVDTVNDLRDALRRELATVDFRLDSLHGQLVEVTAGFVAASPARDADEPLDEEQRAYWMARSRGQEPGERFSALFWLGRQRSDEAVQACRERLEEPDELTIVRWMAIVNLGRFQERAEAHRVARFLGDDEPVMRAAAASALGAMGAPDAGYDPVAPAEERAGPAGELASWAAAQR